MRRLILAGLLFLTSHILPGQIVINEICSANGDINYDPAYFNFSGWVELYNAGAIPVNIGGYYLTDKPTLRNKWRIPSNTSIPSKGFLLIWCDEANSALHTNFSLDPDGEDVVLSNPSQVVVDHVTFPKQHLNISYGRTNNGGSVWGHLIVPTPATGNNPLTGTVQAEKPTITLTSGKYTSVQTTRITHVNSQVVIRFTLDGAEPTANSPVYKDDISINRTLTVKAKAFTEGSLPSETVVATYIVVPRTLTLPIVSISTKPDYLWNNTIGIYTNGTNGIPGNCQAQSFNWNQDWDRHAVLEILDPSGKKRFAQDVDIRIGGACSRGNPQKSIVIKARDKYGSKTIDQKLFSTKDANSYGGFILRNSGNDFPQTMFRDALMQSLIIGQMDIDYLAYEPAIFFLNGEYWGIQNIREKIDADYMETNFGVDRDDLDLLEREYALEGSATEWLSYLNTLQAMDLSSDAAYELIDQKIDVQEFINYTVAEIYYANTDWPGNNVKFWRQRSVNGKWRWILWDTDFGFALYTDLSYATHPTLNFATETSGPDWPNPPWSTRHLRLLLQNPEFRDRFISTFSAALSTTFHPDRVVGMIDQFANRLRAEMPNHRTRWNQSMDGWNWEVQRLRDFARQRNTYMRNHLAQFFGLANGSVVIDVSVFPTNSGGFTLNGITTKADQHTASYHRGIPYSVQPAPNPGFRFSHWNVRTRETESITLVEKQSTWKYFDQGTIPAAQWQHSTYNDAAWSQGPGKFGYGESDENTVVSFGPNAANKYTTTYFRKTIVVSDTVGFGSVTGGIRVDDGAVIYLNGEEVHRDNMPHGAISYNTFASTATGDETSYKTFTIPKGIIKIGENILAVEVHQNSASSSDLTFDLELTTVRVGAETEFTTDEPNLSGVAGSDVILEATFEPVAFSQGVVINEVSPRPSSYLDEYGDADDWIELYNTSASAIDIAGYYITDNLATKKKYRIPAGNSNETVIQPGGYKILWADEETHEGPLHINIKLSAEGEAVGLYQDVEGELITMDELTYPEFESNRSFSRLPNGSGAFRTTTLMTPLEENQEGIPTDREDDLTDIIQISPNPSEGTFMIMSPFAAHGVEIFNAQGRLISSYKLVSSGESISLPDQASGIYLVRIRYKETWILKKVMIQ